MDTVTKEGLSRMCMNLGAALPKDDMDARQLLADLQARVEACAPTDTAGLALLASEVEAFTP